MIICPKCSHVMLGQPVLCTACGKPLLVPAGIEDTLVIESGELRTAPRPQKVWRPAEVGRNLTVELRINGNARSVTLSPNGVVLLGRKDAASSLAPDVDLSPYDAYDRGVSRLHAALLLDKGTLMIKDVGSTNGTYVNGQQVTGDQRRILRDRDELRLGTLSLTVHFDNPDQDAPSPAG